MINQHTVELLTTAPLTRIFILTNGPIEKKMSIPDHYDSVLNWPKWQKYTQSVDDEQVECLKRLG